VAKHLDQPEFPQELVGDTFREGDMSTMLSEGFLDHVANLFPMANQRSVRIAYYKCHPKLCKPDSENDFFRWEFMEYHQWAPIHTPGYHKFDYYRSYPIQCGLAMPGLFWTDCPKEPAFLANLFMPMQPVEKLDPLRVEYYKHRYFFLL
jgi:hypothetical protein